MFEAAFGCGTRCEPHVYISLPGCSVGFYSVLVDCHGQRPGLLPGVPRFCSPGLIWLTSLIFFVGVSLQVRSLSTYFSL